MKTTTETTFTYKGMKITAYNSADFNQDRGWVLELNYKGYQAIRSGFGSVASAKLFLPEILNTMKRIASASSVSRD